MLLDFRGLLLLPTFFVTALGFLIYFLGLFLSCFLTCTLEAEAVLFVPLVLAICGFFKITNNYTYFGGITNLNTLL